MLTLSFFWIHISSLYHFHSVWSFILQGNSACNEFSHFLFLFISFPLLIGHFAAYRILVYFLQSLFHHFKYLISPFSSSLGFWWEVCYNFYSCISIGRAFFFFDFLEFKYNIPMWGSLLIVCFSVGFSGYTVWYHYFWKILGHYYLKYFFDFFPPFPSVFQFCLCNTF